MLSVIIPCFNASRTLGRVLSSLRGLDIEVIVVDGGSDDMTCSIASEFGVCVIESVRGRGIQLDVGGRSASGDWFLFLHADTVLDLGWLEEVRDFISVPDNVHRCGYFGYCLDAPDFMARFLEYVVWFRCSFFCLPYGDQGLLISRIFYDRLGGFKRIPLMEDVDIVRRIVRFGGRGSLVCFRSFAHTDARRYRSGYWRRMFRNFVCLCLWYIGVRPEFLVKLYR